MSIQLHHQEKSELQIWGQDMWPDYPSLHRKEIMDGGTFLVRNSLWTRRRGCFTFLWWLTLFHFSDVYLYNYRWLYIYTRIHLYLYILISYLHNTQYRVKAIWAVTWVLEGKSFQVERWPFTFGYVVLVDKIFLLAQSPAIKRKRGQVFHGVVLLSALPRVSELHRTASCRQAGCDDVAIPDFDPFFSWKLLATSANRCWFSNKLLPYWQGHQDRFANELDVYSLSPLLVFFFLFPQVLLFGGLRSESLGGETKDQNPTHSHHQSSSTAPSRETRLQGCAT